MNHIATVVIMLGTLCALGGCERERRDFQHPGPDAASPQQLRMGELTAGAPAPRPPAAANGNEHVAYDLSEGKRLFHWYNCSGCHAEGGGDKGPALMDDVWIYGSDPANVFATIVEGRPNGMPSFGGKIPEFQVWQIVAYVRSMSGLASKTASPSRDDAIHARPAEQRTDPQPPRSAALPSSSQR